MRKPLAGLAAIVLLAACSEETDKRGIEVLPDMFHTPAAKSQTAGEVQVDARDAKGAAVKRTVQYPDMLTPPAGTIPRDGAAYPLAANDFAGARLLVDPVVPTRAVLRQGQKDFLTFCAPCHGRDGDAAHGYVAKYFSGIPSLNALGTLQLADGEIYHIVTMGRGRMPNLRAQLPPERRWGVVQFVKVQARAVTADKDASTLLPYFDEQIASHPEDQTLKARRAQAVAIGAQAKADLEALAHAPDGREFEPLPAAVPEYIGPEWPAPPEPSK